jgi:glycosyltransferase involved in cell wall biosynthesis
MILGMPCISTFVGGVGSLITDKVNGILIQSGDPWCMAGAILELLSNQDFAEKLGNNARNLALQRHDRERITQGLINIYNNIITDYNYY